MLWIVSLALALFAPQIPEAAAEATGLASAVASFRLLTSETTAPPSEMTVFVTVEACRFVLRYRTPGGEVEVVRQSALAPGEPPGQAIVAALQDPVLMPIGRTVKLVSTATETVQRLSVPAIGLGVDAVPGALRESWMRIERPGTYVGGPTRGCTEPRGDAILVLRGVEPAQFDAWVVAQRPAP